MDSIDEEILYHVKGGKTNAYQTWKAMDKESNGNAIAYKNIRERFINLSNKGFIEQLQISGITLHGRIDYKISNKCRLALQQHIRRLEEILK